MPHRFWGWGIPAWAHIWWISLKYFQCPPDRGLRVWKVSSIQDSAHSIFTRLSGLEFSGKLCKQVTDKLSEHKWQTVFLCISTGGINFILSFILSLIYFLSICTNFPFRLYHYHSTPSTYSRWSCASPPTAATAYSTPDTLGQDCLLLWALLFRRRM